jgi:hypothetical protein
VSDAPWDVHFAVNARRDMQRLDPDAQAHAIAWLERLANAPDRAPGIRRLPSGAHAVLSGGSWRAVFEVDTKTRTVYVVGVFTRGEG